MKKEEKKKRQSAVPESAFDISCQDPACQSCDTMRKKMK